MHRLELALPCPRFERPAAVLLRELPDRDEPTVAPTWCSCYGNQPLDCPARCLSPLPRPSPG